MQPTILVGVIAEKAGIFVTEGVFENLQLVISASDKLQSLPSPFLACSMSLLMVMPCLMQMRW